MLFKKLKTLGEVKSCLAITFAWPSKPSFDGNHRDSGWTSDYFLFNSWFKSNISVAIAPERENLNVIAHLYLYLCKNSFTVIWKFSVLLLIVFLQYPEMCFVRQWTMNHFTTHCKSLTFMETISANNKTQLLSSKLTLLRMILVTSCWMCVMGMY